MDKKIPRVVPLGESAVLVTWGNGINKPVNREVHALAGALRKLNIKGIADVIPAYSSVAVIFDLPVFFSFHHPLPLEFLQLKLEEIYHSVEEWVEEPSRVITIPVCYDTALGNDLHQLATENNIASEEIIQIHASGKYYVYMLGFLPGFSYMGEVDGRIAFARKDKPVPVKAGAVAIAGRQTGIYPVNSPGGWNVVGYTPAKVFDASSSDPCLIEPGSTVVFEPIDAVTYHRLQMQTQS